MSSALTGAPDLPRRGLFPPADVAFPPGGGASFDGGCAFDSVGSRLRSIHARLVDEIPGVDRIAVSLLDRETGALVPFARSGPPGASAPFRPGALPASTASAAGPGASGGSTHAVPIRERGELVGLLSFESRSNDLFSEAVVRSLGPVSELVAANVLLGLAPARMLRAALRITSLVSGFRDSETGEHLQRVSRYARFAALRISPRGGLSDEFAELLYLFTPVHDVGKLAIPERILLKAGPLTEAEVAVVRTHVSRGTMLVDDVVREMGLETLPAVQVLRNVVRHHHEAFDGSGYPDGLAGERIPLEARIVAVADVYDALTAPRPYKEPWSPEAAREYLEENAGSLFDPACVEALFADAEALEEIRTRFWEPGVPPPHVRAASGAWRWRVEAALEDWALAGPPQPLPLGGSWTLPVPADAALPWENASPDAGEPLRVVPPGKSA
jgi:HD-GYP domain-containing protein (c-di-GMP phosphodiesterase class II)